MSSASASQLSVLLPCRDAAEHLPTALRSLEMQTSRGFEVVAVDDGSIDGTGTILERWAAREARVKVIHLERLGVTEALQIGSAACAGELLARLDADDVAHPRRFTQQIQLMNERRDLTAVGTHIRYFPSEHVGWGARRYQRWLNGLTDPDSLARDIFVECPIAHPTLMVRRAAFEEVGGYRSNGWPEDYDLILRLHFAGAQLANVPRVLHFWRESKSRASRTDPRYSPEAFRECKINYLRQTFLRNRREIAIWGAGRVGKDFARSLSRVGVRVVAFYDIDPRKIGQEIHGAPVRDARTVAQHRDTYLLILVGAAGAREMIRRELDEQGLREPRDYACLA